MNKILQSEHLKQKHTFQKKLIYLAPLVSIAIAFVLMGGYYIQKSAYNWWYTLILPGSFTMICSFFISNDRKRKFNGLFSVIVDKQKILYSKIIISTMYLGLSCLVFFVVITIMGFIFETAIQVQNSLLASTILFITFSWQIPVLMYLTMIFSTGFTIIFSILCMGIFLEYLKKRDKKINQITHYINEIKNRLIKIFIQITYHSGILL